MNRGSRGEPITRHCERRQLDLPARLDLFRQICDGIQHAHQKGILHRDIKPSNILVVAGATPSSGCPKVIDFGLARSLKPPYGDDFEAGELLVGTPAYMSPEQFAGEPGVADTRTDTYALGALLYELLTGSTPFDEPPTRSLTASELRRQRREHAPTRPRRESTPSLSGEGHRIRSHRHPHSRAQLRGEFQRQLTSDGYPVS